MLRKDSRITYTDIYNTIYEEIKRSKLRSIEHLMHRINILPKQTKKIDKKF
jgi:hypothetical protein